MNSDSEQHYYPPKATGYLGLKAGLLAGCGLIAGSAAARLLPGLITINSFDAQAIGATVAALGCLGAGLFVWNADRQHLLAQLMSLEQTMAETTADVYDQHKKMQALEKAIATGALNTGQGDTQQIKSELQVLQQLLAQVIRVRSKTPATANNGVDTPITVPKLKPVNQPSLFSNMTEVDALTVMRSAIEDSRIDLYLQPIVFLLH